AMGIDGGLVAYVLLQPQEGWKFLKASLGDPKNEFTYRWAALKAVRFLYTPRPDALAGQESAKVEQARKELAAGVLPLLGFRDVADMAIDDLRLWRRRRPAAPL